MNPPAGSTLPTVTALTGLGEPNSQVTVTLDGMVVGTALTDWNGRWTVTLANPPADGNRSVTAVGDRHGRQPEARLGRSRRSPSEAMCLWSWPSPRPTVPRCPLTRP